ncbi:MAG: threonine/serine dehydratase [Pseudomonadota bacterium]
MNWIEEISRASERLSGDVLRTPMFHSTYLSAMNKGEVYLKLESEQHTGSFKARGALNKIRSMSEAERNAGMITASTGNHAQGFARAVGLSGGRGTIYLPTTASPAKVEALGYYPVELEFYGAHALETELHAKAVAEESGVAYVSPYNDAMVVAGQGTIAVEMVEQCPDLDYVFACVGGGGMMSGVAAWYKHHSPDTKIIGCLPERSPEMAFSVAQGKVVVIEEAQETLSDGSAGGLEEDSITFPMCQEYVDEFCLLNEEEIADAIRFMAHRHQKIVEGAAGVAIAAFKQNAEKYQGARVGIVVCGANITMEKLKAII